MFIRYIAHVRNCLTIRKLLRNKSSENLENLYWYDMKLKYAVSWRGILKVVIWGILKNNNNEIAKNYSKISIYCKEPPAKSINESNPPVWNCKSLSSKAWHDERSFTRDLLEKNAKEIISDYKTILNSIKTHPDNSSLTPRGKWIGLFFSGVNGWDQTILNKCPNISRILKQLPICQNFGFAMLSGTEAKTIISPHCGSSNLRLRNHLGVDIPEPNAVKIRVGNEWRYWKQNKTISFDDSFEHEVKHEGNQLRVVLSVDIWHPSLSKEDIKILSHNVFKDFGYFILKK